MDDKLKEIIKEELTNTAANVWERLTNEFGLNKSDVCLEYKKDDSKVSLLFKDTKLTFSVQEDYVKHYITEGDILLKDSQYGTEKLYVLGGVNIQGGQVVSANDKVNYIAYTKLEGIVIEKVETKESEFKTIEISIEDFGSDWEHHIKTQV